MYIYTCICMHIYTDTYNLLWNTPTNLQARYDLFCVESAVKPQPTNQPCSFVSSYSVIVFQFLFCFSNFWLLCISGDLNLWLNTVMLMLLMCIHNSQRVEKCTSSPLCADFSMCCVCFFAFVLLLLNSVVLLLNLQVLFRSIQWELFFPFSWYIEAWPQYWYIANN